MAHPSGNTGNGAWAWWLAGVVCFVTASATAFLNKNPVVAEAAKQHVAGEPPANILGPRMTVLVVGAGKSAHTDPLTVGPMGSSDFVALVRFDVEKSVLAAVVLPPELELGRDGRKPRTIQRAYAEKGVSGLEAEIESFYDIPLDRHLVLDFESFAQFIDKLGGLELEVQSPVFKQDTKGVRFYVNLNKGTYLLDGTMALAYARVQGSETNKTGRADWAGSLMKALKERLRSHADQLPGLAAMVGHTTLSFAELAAIMRFVADLDSGGLVFDASAAHSPDGRVDGSSWKWRN